MQRPLRSTPHKTLRDHEVCSLPILLTQREETEPCRVSPYELKSLLRDEPMRRAAQEATLEADERMSLTIENFIRCESDYTHSEIRRETEEALQLPESVNDCALDDPDMFTLKSHLIRKVTPLSLINVLQSKHPKLNITEHLVEIPNKNTKLNPRYSCSIEALGSTLRLRAESFESNKKLARHVAAQRFLKVLFPQGHIYTWNKVSQLVTTMKEPLAHLQ